MSNRTNIDADLARWGERVFNSGPVEQTKSKRGITGLRLMETRGRGGDVSAAAKANDTRRRLNAIAKRTPQVMVKISGGGKTIAHVKAHLDYISRDGQLPLEDQHGDKFEGTADVEALRDEWRFGGFPMREGTSRLAFNIVLSMPAGTDDQALLRAARDFAQLEFSQFQYAMVLHTFATDPDESPSPNPHVHLCVKRMALDGTILSPRKADLQRWREGFAHSLREHGVDADASRRLHRMQRVRGDKQSVRRKKERKESFDKIGKSPASPERVAKAKLFEAQMVANFDQLAAHLATSENRSDRRLASDFAERMKGHVLSPRPPGHEPEHD